MFFLAIGCAMGCGAGGGKGRGLGIPKCGKGHEPCSKNPKGHCDLTILHTGKHVSDACGKSF